MRDKVTIEVSEEDLSLIRQLVQIGIADLARRIGEIQNKLSTSLSESRESVPDGQNPYGL